MRRISPTNPASSRRRWGGPWAARAAQAYQADLVTPAAWQAAATGTRRASGHRRSGSASRRRRLFDPEGDGSFEQITLHPQPGVVALQLAQPGLLVAGQPVLLATIDAVLPHPVAQRRVVDPQLPGDLGDRPARGTHQLHRIALELGGELPPGSSLLVGHLDILLSAEVSCLRGEVHRGRAPAHGAASLLGRTALP